MSDYSPSAAPLPAKALNYRQKVRPVCVGDEKAGGGRQCMVGCLLIGLFTNGHILPEGVPGLVKVLISSPLPKVPIS